jgi:cobalt transporter subunit CbtB
MTATTTTTRVQTATMSQRLVLGLSLMFFGIFVIYGIGISQNSTAHSAAHDTRHSLGFPCH